MHLCPGNWTAIGRAVVYYARTAYAFSTGIKWRHCSEGGIYNDEYIVTGLADKGGVIVVEDVAVNEGFRQVSDLKVYTETLEVLIHEHANNMNG